MNKKEYIKPETEELLIEPAQMIAASMPKVDDEEADDDSEVLSDERHEEIEWGNLWN
jgi:hypothetical protein